MTEPTGLNPFEFRATWKPHHPPCNHIHWVLIPFNSGLPGNRRGTAARHIGCVLIPLNSGLPGNRRHPQTQGGYPS